MIGLPGDHMQMVHGRLMINGQMVTLEPAGTGKVEDRQTGMWMTSAGFTETLPGGVKHIHLQGRAGTARWTTRPSLWFPPATSSPWATTGTIPLDSRVAPEDGGVGFVPAENLVARADLMLGSYDLPQCPRRLDLAGPDPPVAVSLQAHLAPERQPAHNACGTWFGGHYCVAVTPHANWRPRARGDSRSRIKIQLIQ